MQTLRAWCSLGCAGSWWWELGRGGAAVQLSSPAVGLGPRSDCTPDPASGGVWGVGLAVSCQEMRVATVGHRGKISMGD